MYFTTYNRDMGEITMEPAYHGIEEETVTRLPSKAFDEFLKALDRPVPQTARDLIGMECVCSIEVRPMQRNYSVRKSGRN